MGNNIYFKRIADAEIAFILEAKGAVQILGPKFCGKTTTAKQFAKTVIKMKDPDYKDEYIAIAKTKPSNLLKGENPVLIDEWQIVPSIYDAVRTSCDDRNENGLYILTGSNSIKLGDEQHSGTGRISKFNMYPLSLYESKESNGSISLKDVFDGNFNEGAISNLDINNLIFSACRGGWPTSLLSNNPKVQLFVAKDYLKGICNSDMKEVDAKDRDPNKTRAILRSYARNISTLAKDSTIYADVAANYQISDRTYDDYVKALKSLFIIDNVEAWCPAIRSKGMIRSGEKRELVDPSIAVAALGLSPEALQKDLKTFGFIFECLCFRDLRVYSQALDANINYYHDSYGLEADAVLHLDDGRYALIEFKLGSDEIEKGAKNLLKLVKLIKEHNEKEKQCPIRLPDQLWIITGGKIAYTREDGVKIIPIGCLKD